LSKFCEREEYTIEKEECARARARTHTHTHRHTHTHTHTHTVSLHIGYSKKMGSPYDPKIRTF